MLNTIDGQTIQRLAIVRLSALGDVVMMLAMVRRLQASFPQMRITWIVAKPFDQLLRYVQGIELVVIDKPRSLSDYWRLKKQLAAYRFDVLLAAQANLRVNAIYPLIRAKLKIGFDRQRSREGHRFFVHRQVAFKPNHILDSFMQFADMLGAVRSAPTWQLPLEPAAVQQAAQWLGGKRWIAINAMASKADRNWPLASHVALANQIWQRWRLPVVLTGGPSALEIERAAYIAEHTQAECLNLVGKTGLPELAAVLAKVALLVSPDTGPLHLARALQTPVVGLYADITAKLSGPYQAEQGVIDKYEQALQLYKGLKAEQVAWGTRVHDARAMALITVDEVLAKIAELLPEVVGC
jgi:heptosyltransferase I